MPLPVSQAYMAIRCGLKPSTYVCVECGQVYHCFRSPAADTTGVLAACPTCGRFQPNMVASVRNNRTNWVLVIGVLVFLFDILIFFTTALPVLLGPRDDKTEKELPRLFVGSSVMLGVALGLIWWGWIRHRQMNPNSAPQEQRIAQGKLVSLTAEAYREAEAHANDLKYSPPQSQGALIDGLAGSSQRWNGSAIFYTIMGAGLTIIGIWSLIDPQATKLYLGAVIFGPILFLRYVTRIRE